MADTQFKSFDGIFNQYEFKIQEKYGGWFYHLLSKDTWRGPYRTYEAALTAMKNEASFVQGRFNGSMI